MKSFLFYEKPDDVNNFTKRFAHILNFGFYCPYYILFLSWLLRLPMQHCNDVILFSKEVIHVKFDCKHYLHSPRAAL